MSAVDKAVGDSIAFDSSNVNLLSQQHAHHFLHIIGQQESRLPAKKKLTSLYIIIASGTNPRHGLGCSIWASRFLPYYQLNGNSYCFHMKQFFVVHADPRLLVVDVDAPFLRMRMISAHAPIARDPSARVTFFKLLSKYVNHANRILIFIDANSRPQDTISNAKSGSNTYLRDASEQFTLFLETSKLGSSHGVSRFSNSTVDTWTSHKTRSKYTIDYVVTKLEDTTAISHASVLSSVDNGHMLQDHVPSGATLVFIAGPGYYRPSCDRVRVTKTQLQDPVNRAAFASALNKITSIPWHIPLDVHYTVMSAKVSEAIKASSPTPKMIANRPYISISTLFISGESRSLKQQLRFLRSFSQ